MPSSYVHATWFALYQIAKYGVFAHPNITRRITATAVRFIIPPSVPMPSIKSQMKSLEILLEGWPKRSQCGVDGLLVDCLYEEILSLWLFPMAEDNQAVALSVLQTVICAEEPLLICDIHQLLDTPQDVIDVEQVQSYILALHSVLYLSKGRVNSYHKSFIDFLFDNTRFGKRELALRICPTPQRQICLASACFQLMESLRFNICGLLTSYDDDSQVDDLQDRIHNNITSALRYACRHWAQHLSKTPAAARAKRMMTVFRKWLEESLLFWMEVMNLLQATGECYHMLEAARLSFATIITQEELKDLVAAENLAITFGTNIIAKSTPHLYISALAASSAMSCDSRLMTHWFKQFPGIPVITPLNRDSPLALLSNNDSVYAGSPASTGGNGILSISNDSVRLLDFSSRQEHFRLYGNNKLQLIGFRTDRTPDSHAPAGTLQILDSNVSGHVISNNTREYNIHISKVATGPRLSQRNEYVCSVSLSPDGAYVASGSHSGILYIWEVEMGHQLLRINAHSSPLTSTSFSPDGRHIVSAASDGTIHSWNAASGKQIFHMDIPLHQGPVNSLSFSPDGTSIISASDDKTVRVWDSKRGRQLYRLGKYEGPVTSAIFSPYSRNSQIISTSNDATVRIWDSVTGNQLHELRGHSGCVLSARFSSNRRYIVSGSWDNTVCIWDTMDASHETLEGHCDWVTSVSFSPDGTHIVSGSYDCTLCIWDAKTRAKLATMQGHTDSVTSVSFSPDGTHVVSGSRDCTMRMWDVKTGTELVIMQGHTDSVTSVSFSPDGTHIVSGSRDCTMRIWDIKKGIRLQILQGHTDGVTSVSFSTDGTHIISGSRDHTVRIWETSTGAQLYQLNGHEGAVCSTNFSPDGTQIVSASIDGTVCVWDTETRLQVLQNKFRDSVNSVEFSSDETHIITASEDGTVRNWSRKFGKQALQFTETHTGCSGSVFVLSPDAKYMISSSSLGSDYSVQISEVSTGQHQIRLDHNGWVSSVSYSPSGLHIVSGVCDGTICISHAVTGDVLHHLDVRDPDNPSPSLASGSVGRSSEVVRWRGDDAPLDGQHIISSLSSGNLPYRIIVWKPVQSDGKYTDWHMRPDGWITSPNDERYLWLSAEMHHSLPPHQSLFLSSLGSIKVDFTKSHLGPEWHRCYDPNK